MRTYASSLWHRKSASDDQQTCASPIKSLNHQYITKAPVVTTIKPIKDYKLKESVTKF